MDRISEINPLAPSLVLMYAPVAMVGLILGGLGGCFLLWKSVPRPYRAGIPLGLVLVGVTVTVWNRQLLFVLVFG